MYANNQINEKYVKKHKNLHKKHNLEAQASVYKNDAKVRFLFAASGRVDFFTDLH